MESTVLIPQILMRSRFLTSTKNSKVLTCTWAYIFPEGDLYKMAIKENGRSREGEKG
jgi:hypothetical protein